MALPDEPLTRTEQYLNRTATGSGTIPDEPLTRVEQYLAYIAENGSGGGGGSGMSAEAVAALLDCFAHVAWVDDDGQDYYDALHEALTSEDPTPSATVTSISAVFTQGSAVIYDTDDLDTLKQYLVVTATMSDSTTRTVTDYTLSGTLEDGTSVVTVSYCGKTATFNVTVTYDTRPKITNTGSFLHQNGTIGTNENACVTDFYSFNFESLPYTLFVNFGGIIGEASPHFCTYNESKTQVNQYSTGKLETKYFAWGSSDPIPPPFFRASLYGDGSASYAYIQQTGEVIFAGANSPYHGMHNISEAS